MVQQLCPFKVKVGTRGYLSPPSTYHETFLIRLAGTPFDESEACSLALKDFVDPEQLEDRKACISSGFILRSGGYLPYTPAPFDVLIACVLGTTYFAHKWFRYSASSVAGQIDATSSSSSMFAEDACFMCVHTAIPIIWACCVSLDFNTAFMKEEVPAFFQAANLLLPWLCPSSVSWFGK